jgi:hypothetical protein
VFDTDVDRSAIVDGNGTPINSNRFIALMAAIVLQVRACGAMLRNFSWACWRAYFWSMYAAKELHVEHMFQCESMLKEPC